MSQLCCPAVALYAVGMSSSRASGGTSQQQSGGHKGSHHADRNVQPAFWPLKQNTLYVFHSERLLGLWKSRLCA